MLVVRLTMRVQNCADSRLKSSSCWSPHAICLRYSYNSWQHTSRHWAPRRSLGDRRSSCLAARTHVGRGGKVPRAGVGRYLRRSGARHGPATEAAGRPAANCVDAKSKISFRRGNGAGNAIAERKRVVMPTHPRLDRRKQQQLMRNSPSARENPTLPCARVSHRRKDRWRRSVRGRRRRVISLLLETSITVVRTSTMLNRRKSSFRHTRLLVYFTARNHYFVASDLSLIRTLVPTPQPDLSYSPWSGP